MSFPAANPLERPVQQILDSPSYLTASQIQRLRNILPKAKEDEAGVDINRSLKQQLSAQLEMLKRLEHLGQGSQDVGEVRQIMASQRDMFNLLGKFQSALESEEKLQVIETSIIAALEETKNEPLKERFLAIWKERLMKLRKNT